MIARDELKKVFKLFSKYDDLLINAYLEHGGVVDDLDESYKVTEALIDARLVWRPADNEPIRLTREMMSLFERILRDPRRLSVNADIGGFLINLENSVNRYREARKFNSKDDVELYISQIERLVDDLRNTLLDSSNHLWQKTNSELGYVSTLRLKIAENNTVIAQAQRLIDSLELIKTPEITEMAGSDPQLRKYLLRWLLSAAETCRKETVDAMHKLNALLFKFRKQDKLGRVIDSLYRHYQNNPGYVPMNYSDMTTLPELFNQVAPLKLSGHADLYDPSQQVALFDILSTLRKERVEAEVQPIVERMVVADGYEVVHQSLPALFEAVESFYSLVIDSGDRLSAFDNRPSNEDEFDPELWIYAVIAKHNGMTEVERSVFDFSYIERTDCVFNGLRHVNDVKVSLKV